MWSGRLGCGNRGWSGWGGWAGVCVRVVCVGLGWGWDVLGCGMGCGLCGTGLVWVGGGRDGLGRG